MSRNIRIGNPDKKFRLAVLSVLRDCEPAASIFFVLYEEEMGRPFLRCFNQDWCFGRVKIWTRNEHFSVYEGPCPFRMLREAFDQSPLFLRIYQKMVRNVVLNRNAPEQDKTNFLVYSAGEMSVLFSANQQRVPAVSEEKILQLIRESNNNPERFYGQVAKDLKRLDRRWLRRICGFSKNGQLRPMLFMLKVFLEGIKEERKPLPPAEEVVSAVESFLASERDKGA